MEGNKYRNAQACASGGERYWKRHNHQLRKEDSKEYILGDTYQTHFNVDLQRCLIAIDSVTTDLDKETVFIYDAFEGRPLAMLVMFGSPSGGLTQQTLYRFHLGGFPTFSFSKAWDRVSTTAADIAWFVGLMER
jgi:hypothetical protein